MQNLEYFNSHRYGLSIKIFKYKFIKSVDTSYFNQYVLMDPKNIKEERHNRSKFLKSQIKTLKRELIDSRSSELEHREVDYDALSLYAESLFNSVEQLENNEAISTPEEQQQEQQQPEDEEQEDCSIYRSQLITPYIESIYSSIDSMDTFMRVLNLVHNFGFKFRNLNEALIRIAESKMQFKDKIKIMMYCFENYIKKRDDDEDQKNYKVSVQVITRLFDMLVGSHYNQKCEKLVNNYLSHVYQNDVNDDNEIDTELWEYVKNSKEADLFQILCGYSTPNFSL